MPAAVVRGILLTVGIIAALGLAAYESPEIQQWLDEQRRKLAQFLRNIGDELDPQTRREAEAFAYGAAPAGPSSESTRAETTATTTGSEAANANIVRRIPVQGSSTTEEREERQRLGEEYLTRRRQQMLEMQERRQNTVSRSMSFDPIVDEEAHLKKEDAEFAAEGFSDLVKQESIEPVAESSSSNPFTDDHELERSQTPRPDVPPKIKLEHIEPVSHVLSLEHIDPVPYTQSLASEPLQHDSSADLPGPMPGAMPSPDTPNDLSYEEQLAIALSLSKEEEAKTLTMTDSITFDQQLNQAIRLSLQGHRTTAAAFPDPDVSVPPTLADSVDELYDVTPNLTRASLAQFNDQHPSLQPQRTDLLAATSGAHTPHEQAISPVTSRSQTISEVEMIDIEDQASDVISQDGIVTPDSWTEVGDSDEEMPVAAQ